MHSCSLSLSLSLCRVCIHAGGKRRHYHGGGRWPRTLRNRRSLTVCRGASAAPPSLFLSPTITSLVAVFSPIRSFLPVCLRSIFYLAERFRTRLFRSSLSRSIVRFSNFKSRSRGSWFACFNGSSVNVVPPNLSTAITDFFEADVFDRSNFIPSLVFQSVLKFQLCTGNLNILLEKQKRADHMVSVIHGNSSIPLFHDIEPSAVCQVLLRLPLSPTQQILKRKFDTSISNQR